MFKEVDVIFFVEHKDRELESIKLIAEKLRSEGKSSLILSVYFHVHYLYLYKAKTFVFPYLINQNDWPVSLVYKMYGDTAEYINMNWEQLISKVNEEYKKPQDDFVKQKVKHIAWNSHFRDYLVRYGVDESNIAITGNLSNEILFNLLDKKNEWRSNLAQEFELDTNKKWLFMPMNYGWAFSTNSLINAKIKKGYPEKTAWEYREYSQKCLKQFIYFIEKLSKEFDYEIIIRPHPSITEDDYKKVFNETIGYIPKNIYLNKAHSIREWIVASDVVGSSWSTSVWDAYNVGKPVFLFTPYKRPEWLDVWWNDEIVNLESEYSEIVLSIKNYDIKSDSVQAKISKYICLNIFSSNKRVRIHLINKIILKGLLCSIFKLHKCKNLMYDYFDRILYDSKK